MLCISVYDVQITSCTLKTNSDILMPHSIEAQTTYGADRTPQCKCHVRSGRKIGAGGGVAEENGVRQSQSESHVSVSVRGPLL